MRKLLPSLAAVASAFALFLVTRPLVAAECSSLDVYAAEEVADYPDSWKNVHLAFQEFAKCDDGGVAEGYSEAVARLLADRWNTLPELVRLIHSDPPFEAFILRSHAKNSYAQAFGFHEHL